MIIRGEEATYDSVASALGARLCGPQCWKGDGRQYTLVQHTRGFVDTWGVVHWRRRGMVHRGLHAFLKLVARARLGTEETTEVWRIWVEATEAYELGIQLGVRFPREYSADDRARVRALLAKGPALDEETRERITRWARD